MWETGRETWPGGSASAWLPDGTALDVVAATHEALRARVPEEATLKPGATVELSLGDSQPLAGPFPATLRALDGSGDRRFATFELHAMTAERRRQLAAMLLRWPAPARRGVPERTGLTAHTLLDPQHILAVLTAIASEGQRGLVRRPGSEDAWTGTRVKALDFDRADDLPLHWHFSGPAPTPPFIIEVGAGDVVYALPVVRARVEGDRLATAVPDELFRSSRAARWLTPVPDDVPARIRLNGSGERPLRRTGPQRLAFAIGARPTPGARLPATLSVAGSRIHGTITVESFRPCTREPGELCVARFEPTGPTDAARWSLARERLEHPHTRRAGTWAGNLWELYDKSGYFQLSGKTSAHFTPLRNAFALATRRLDTAPEIGCHVVWPSRERIEAALSVLFVYSGTALVYQVARRRDESAPVSGRQMLREVNVHAFEHLRRDEGFDWTLVYVQEGGARWSHLAYQTFAESQLSTGLSCVLRFRAMESGRVTPAPVPLPAGVRIGPPTGEERARFLAALPKLRPAPYLEALDLVPERLDLADVRRRWASAGFQRERSLLVASRQGQPLMVAVLESAQDALHLFGLLDCVRFFGLAPGGEEAIPALLEAARGWFQERRKTSFVCFFEAECFDHAFQPGLTDLGAANLMAFPRLLLPDFLEHLHLITAPRQRGH